jgi:hypothetical protein
MSKKSINEKEKSNRNARQPLLEQENLRRLEQLWESRRLEKEKSDAIIAEFNNKFDQKFKEYLKTENNPNIAFDQKFANFLKKTSNWQDREPYKLLSFWEQPNYQADRFKSRQFKAIEDFLSYQNSKNIVVSTKIEQSSKSSIEKVENLKNTMTETSDEHLKHFLDDSIEYKKYFVNNKSVNSFSKIEPYKENLINFSQEAVNNLDTI